MNILQWILLAVDCPKLKLFRKVSHIFTEPLMAEALIYPELAYSPRYRAQGATINEAVDSTIASAWKEWIDGDIDMTKRNDSIWPLLKQRWSIIEDEDES